MDFVTCFEGGACPTGATADVNLDGFVDIFDYSDFVSVFGHDYSTWGPGIRHLYAGYESDPVLRIPDDDGTFDDVYHVRHRVYQTGLGVWTSRDPYQYILDGNLYEYTLDNPVVYNDFDGQLPDIIPQPCPVAQNCKRLIDKPNTDDKRDDARQDRFEKKACGAGSLEKYIPDKPFDLVNFNDCCRDHDRSYSKCSRNPGVKYDMAFCACLHKSCEEQVPHGFRNLVCHQLASIYCNAVLKVGPTFYCAAQERNCTCCDKIDQFPECTVMPRLHPECLDGTPEVGPATYSPPPKGPNSWGD